MKNVFRAPCFLCSMAGIVTRLGGLALLSLVVSCSSCAQSRTGAAHGCADSSATSVADSRVTPSVEETLSAIIGYDRNLSGCNYTSYIKLHDYFESQGYAALTPAPDGYEAYYVTTYARHGSRFMLLTQQYDDPIKLLNNAAQKHKLTKRGEELFRDLKQLREFCTDAKLGILTETGLVQHRGIAERLCSNFSEVFDADADILAQSSKTERCVLSMGAECAVIDSVVGHHVPQKYNVGDMQERMAGAYKSDAITRQSAVHKSLHQQDLVDNVPYQSFCSGLFTDSQWTQVELLRAFCRDVFHLAQNMQSHDLGIDLWKYFNDDELTALCAIDNRFWYRRYGASPSTEGVMPQSARPQMLDFLAAADSVVNRRDWHGAHLRFGHDICLLPLACLMELGDCGVAVPEDALATLDKKWRCQEIFPMAGNIQLVFYRPKSGEGDVLVKALLNEREVTLPTTPASGPYYRWADVREHWVARITDK